MQTIKAKVAISVKVAEIMKKASDFIKKGMTLNAAMAKAAAG